MEHTTGRRRQGPVGSSARRLRVPGQARVTWDRLLNADKDPNNWLMYHGSFKAWHYSDLDQINATNVKNLRRGLGPHPVRQQARHAVLPARRRRRPVLHQLSGQVWALDGATGDVIWRFQAKLDQERAEGTFYNPYNRGLADRLRQRVHRHHRWPHDRHRHEDRQAGLGQA